MPGRSERILPQKFYARDPRIVARELLGKILVRTLSGRAGTKRLAGRIVEVEVYLGEGDLAAHSAAGKTARNEVLFGPPGHAYVYFIYGVHYCLNFSCMPEGNAGCVLLRAIEPIEGRVLGNQTRVVFRIWIIVFGLVGAQMGWVLRPFIGAPGLPFALFRPRYSNFFEAVLTHLRHLFS